MRYSPFRMERYQSTYEHRVEINLSESGVHPLTVRGLLDLAGGDGTVDDVLLGYGQSNGSDLLRKRIANLYTGATDVASAEAAGAVSIGGDRRGLARFFGAFDHPHLAKAFTTP